MAPEKKFIYDKNGEAYRIEIEESGIGPSFHLRLTVPHIQSSFIGYANFLWEDDRTLKLADIRMNECAVFLFCQKGIYGLFGGTKREDRNCQRIGLGTEFLKYTLEQVKALGVKRVFGHITRDDYQKNPKLPGWYESHGFTVRLNAQQGGNYAKIEIFF